MKVVDEAEALGAVFRIKVKGGSKMTNRILMVDPQVHRHQDHQV